MKVQGHPRLSAILDRNDAWERLGDFDALMQEADQHLQSAASQSEAVEVAKLMHAFSRDHYHVFLVGQYKIRELCRGIGAAIESTNETVLFNLTRSLVEHSASLAYQMRILERAVEGFSKKRERKAIEASIGKHRKAVQLLYYNEKASIHVHDMIKALAAQFDTARREYEALCEFVHPNYGSNRLVSSGDLGRGQIRSHGEELGPDLTRVHWLIERCLMLVDDNFNKEIAFYLGRLASWVEIACEDNAQLSQIFSVRVATIGDGLTKETAISFHRARTPFEEKEAFYGYLKANKLIMSGRRLAAVESNFLYDQVMTDKGTVWVKYRLHSS
ncbi:hypothetical protein [Phyllobacterium ifriqiyense]|uniref:hypothetical protein n=1 Tax=Phyllobacterium ifriqiyense TaxID=314238 RepID=UPI003397373A